MKTTNSTTSTGNAHIATKKTTAKPKKESLKKASTTGKRHDRVQPYPTNLESTIEKYKYRLHEVNESIHRYKRILKNTEEFAEQLKKEITKLEVKEYRRKYYGDSI